MSAFNDYCIVCDKICTNHSVYCSDECQLKDGNSHYDFNNAPQLISPVLEPRSNSIASTLTSSSSSTIECDEIESEVEDDHKHHEYLIKSPLLLSSNVKEHSIAGLNLNDGAAAIPKQSSSIMLDQHHADLLAVSSTNYKKWLNVVL